MPFRLRCFLTRTLPLRAFARAIHARYAGCFVAFGTNDAYTLPDGLWFLVLPQLCRVYGCVLSCAQVC